MSSRAGYQVGMMCFSCGLCFARGTHHYAVYEYLPEEWQYKGATFLICRYCGTAHAVEHASEEGAADRLRSRREPFFLALSPKMRRGWRELLNGLERQSGPYKLGQPKHPERYINLLPPPRWKRTAGKVHSECAERFWRLLDTNAAANIGACLLLPFLIPGFIYNDIQDARWERKHPAEEWQKPNPIAVNSSEPLELRKQQLLDLHRNYEALWPVVRELLPGTLAYGEPSPSEQADRYVELCCSHCGTLGSLVTDLPNPATPRFPYYPMPECPCCGKQSVEGDEIGDTDTSLYLLGDILYDEPAYQLDFIQTFSREVGPAERDIAIFRIHNSGIKPHRITTEPEDAPQIWLPPGHAYEVHIKKIEDISRYDDTSIAHWMPFEVVAVMESGTLVYGAETQRL